MRKRILSLVLAVLMLLSVLPTTVFAEEYSPKDGTSYKEGDLIWVKSYNELPDAGADYEWQYTGQVKSELTCDKEQHQHDWSCYTWQGGHHHGHLKLICQKQEHRHGDRCYTWLYQYKLVSKNAYQPKDGEKLYVAIKNYDDKKDATKFPNEPTCNDDFQYTFFNSSYTAYNYSDNQKMSTFATGTDVAKYVDLNVFMAMNPATNTKKNQDVTVYGFYNANGIDLANCAYMTADGKKIISGHESDMIQNFLNAQTSDSPYFGKSADNYTLLVYVVKYEANGPTPGWHIDCALVPKDNVKLIYDANYAPEAYSKNYADLPATVTANKSDAGTEVTVEALAVNEVFSEASITNKTSKEKLYFAGWNTEEDGTGTWYAADSKITLTHEDITLYAQWRSDKITIEKTVEGLPASYASEQIYSFTATYQGTAKTTKTATIAVSGNTTAAVTGTVTLNKTELDKPYQITETQPGELTIDGDKYTCTVSYIPESGIVNPGETLQVVNTWAKQEAPKPSLTVEKSAMLWRCKTDDNGKVQWSKIDPLQGDVKVKFGDEILYTITVTNNTDEAIPEGLTIADTFNGTGSLSLDEVSLTHATLSQDETTRAYTITLKQPIPAKAKQSISLIYTVQYDDTVLGDSETAKYLTNVATVDGSTSTVEIPVDPDYFNLAVKKQWVGGSSTVTVQLYANGEPLEGKQKEIKKEEISDTNWTVFEELPLREDGKRITYSIKETAIAGATFKGPENVDFNDGEGVKCRDLFETNDKTGEWNATYYDTINTNGRITISNRYFKNPIVVTKEVTQITRSGEALTGTASAKAGDVIHYTITIRNTTSNPLTVNIFDYLSNRQTSTLKFADDNKIQFNGTSNTYSAMDFQLAANTTYTLTAEYTVQVGDGVWNSTNNKYYLTNEVNVHHQSTIYSDEVSTEIEKDEDAYKIYVPIIKTLKNEGTNKFDGERFAFKPYVTGQNGKTYEWLSAHISIGTVAAGHSAEEDNEEAGEPYTVIELTKTDFENLPVDETTNLPYIWISETPGSNSRVTYDSRTYKLYLVPEKGHGSPLLALSMDEEAALPSNHVYDPAGTYTYYAIADLTEWNKDDSTPYDCAAAFVNYYGKQEHRDNTIPVIPQLNRDDHVAYIMGYPDGSVRPEGEITRAEACTIFFRLLTESSRDYYFSRTNNYTDVKAGDWYNNAISTLSNAGIVMGYNDGTFRPNQPITRGEMAKIIANFANLSKGTKSFTDLSGHWSKTYVELAAGNGWIAGYPDGSFRPDQKITRAETVTMINRVLERVPAKESRLLSRSIMLTFPDNNPGDWYYIAIQEASNSHEYQRSVYETAGDETWIKLIENVDWTKLER